jgi:hypothetical protein
MLCGSRDLDDIMNDDDFAYLRDGNTTPLDKESVLPYYDGSDKGDNV